MPTSEKIDPEKLNQFIGKFAGDLGATFHGATVVIGEKLGLYKAIARLGRCSPVELARATGTSERYVREWLAAQAASGYVNFDASKKRYFLTPEQAFALADESSPAYIPCAFYIAQAMFKDEPKITEAFRSGKGVGWHEHSPELFRGTDGFFRPNYVANLVASWLPALDGVVAKLEAGAHVADVGCGYGSSTILMAKTYPKSKIVGYDYHRDSIEAARRLAEEAGVGDRIEFETASASDYPGKNFDLVTFFDCLHDMGDPVGAAKHVHKSLKPDGTWLIVEPFANDSLEENLNPVGRIYYSASTMLCTPSSIAQDVGLALGAQAGDTRLRKVVTEGGFKSFRRAMQTPFNRILEARP